MLGCGCLLSCLLSVTLLHCSAGGLRVRQEPPQYVDRVVSGSQPSLQSRSGEQKVGEELTAKLLLLDHLVRMENDVIEPKRKRSFSNNNTPLDRLSISAMETKQASNKQRKVVESPRRRVSPPIDRIGVSRLPSSRG
ncbi:osteocrin [Centroberyx affinis]|uniref:osteocrin n=1 Tax=Centroberyx affinis TaxID=166261 RepID=UPI003A5C5C69